MGARKPVTFEREIELLQKNLNEDETRQREREERLRE
jgi:hypothetical protein